MAEKSTHAKVGYQCLACRDTGILFDPRFIRPGYDNHIHVPIVCKACNAASRLRDTIRRLDQSASAEECRRLHDLEWKAILEAQKRVS